MSRHGISIFALFGDVVGLALIVFLCLAPLVIIDAVATAECLSCGEW